jgi:hypothetical protein
MPTYVIYGYSPAALSYDPATGTYQLDPNFDFTTGRVRIEVNDDDTYFDGDSERSFHNEIGSDANQTGTVTTPSGATIASGRIYDEQFSEITLTGGGTGWIDQIEIAGQVVGFVTTFELVPGQVYTANFTQDVKFPDTLTYGDYFSVPCFEASVLIETPEGPRSARSLRAGDFVVTRDAGVQRVTWACQTTMLRTAFAPGRAHHHRHVGRRVADPDHDLFGRPQDRAGGRPGRVVVRGSRGAGPRQVTGRSARNFFGRGNGGDLCPFRMRTAQPGQERRHLVRDIISRARGAAEIARPVAPVAVPFPAEPGRGPAHRSTLPDRHRGARLPCLCPTRRLTVAVSLGVAAPGSHCESSRIPSIAFEISWARIGNRSGAASPLSGCTCRLERSFNRVRI